MLACTRLAMNRLFWAARMSQPATTIFQPLMTMVPAQYWTSAVFVVALVLQMAHVTAMATYWTSAVFVVAPALQMVHVIAMATNQQRVTVAMAIA